MHILMNGMRYIYECIEKVRLRIMCRWIWRKLDGYFASLSVALKKELKLSGQLKTFILYYRRGRRGRHHQIVCENTDVLVDLYCAVELSGIWIYLSGLSVR